MDTIYNSIRDFYKTLQPNNQLVIYFAGHLDICHGGSFDENILGGRTRENLQENNLNRNVLQFLIDKNQYTTRWTLSSVGKESAFDGKEGMHSPFANLLLQVLRTRAREPKALLR